MSLRLRVSLFHRESFGVGKPPVQFPLEIGTKLVIFSGKLYQSSVVCYLFRPSMMKQWIYAVFVVLLAVASADTGAGIKTVTDDDLVKLFHSHSNFVVLFCKY